METTHGANDSVRFMASDLGTFTLGLYFEPIYLKIQTKSHSKYSLEFSEMRCPYLSLYHPKTYISDGTSFVLVLYVKLIK